MSTAREEIVQGNRFPFGRNWRRFLAQLDEEGIRAAEGSLQKMLSRQSLKGRRFLDAGCGSGLFSLAAMRLEADAVLSFDFDPESVECARELKRRDFSGSDRWRIEEGSVLDPAYLAGLGTWDVVYSWGVLHHTGRLWRALELMGERVAPGGVLFVALYNDQGLRSRFWRRIKRWYNINIVTRASISAVAIPVLAAAGLLRDIGGRRNPLERYRRVERGMSVVRDWSDWLGGYPFEVARPEEVFRFLRDRGFVLRELATVGGRWGCNEYLFEKCHGSSS